MKYQHLRNELAAAVALAKDPVAVNDDAIRRHMTAGKPLIDELRATLGDTAYEEHWGTVADLERRYAA